MAMGAGGFSSRVVATAVVATDGTGDFTDIPAAIASLPATGGVVYVKEGLYIIATAIAITKPNVSLIGAGKSTIIAPSAPIVAISGDGKDNITIKDLQIDGDAGSSGFTFGIKFENCDDAIIENCLIQNIAADGIYLDNVSNDNIVIDCIIKGCHRHGIEAFGGRVYIHHCLISGSFNSGIVLVAGSNNSKVIGCSVLSNVHNGIWVLSGDCLIQGNRCDANDTGATASYSGIKLDGADRCLIENNHCQSNGDYGIDLTGAGASSNIVIGNHCSLNTTGQINDAGTNTLPNGAVGTTNLALDDLNYV